MFTALPAYAELHCRSNFSFLHGASHAEELAARAAELGYSALAITDECSLAGVVRAHVEAKRLGLWLLVGSSFVLDDGLRLVLIACNRNGYGNLCELITLARMRSAKGEYQLSRADLDSGPDAPHLARVPDCVAILIPDASEPASGSATSLQDDARWCARTFPGRAWIGVTLLRRMNDDLLLDRIGDAARVSGLARVACGDVLMHVRSRKPLQDALTAVRVGKPIADCGAALAANAEQHLRSRLRLGQLYEPELLAETLAVAARCRFSLDELRYEYPEEVVPPGETHAGYLRRMVEDGARARYPQGTPDQVLKLIEHELALIAELRYESYFLTVFDIVRYARGRDILCQGRGSAANSTVCYCLGITEVDPTRQTMLFERFLSKERGEPPDIDVDFEHQRREEVIQYIYRRYGRDRTALAATVIAYRTRSALRDMGRLLGIDAQRLARLSASHAWWDGADDTTNLTDNGFDPDSPVIRKLTQLVRTVRSFPRHLSQHVGGFVISRDKLSRLVPIENAAMAERSIIQWDKDDLQALGLLKVDVLALGMLSAIRRTLDLIGQRHGRLMRMQDIPPEDPATYAMIRAADTIGVFQIESRAQMSMLPRLQPRKFYDLVIEVAIVRPGPIQGDMVHPYLRRRNGEEKIEYPKEELKIALERTCGVPIFQEQVMQLAIIAAGFTPGEADQLRRSMAAWKRKGGLGGFEQRIIGGMTERGYPPEFAERIFRQIQGFGEYGFPESHAISFALLVYVSSWLKCHEPAAFLCALLNSQPLGFYSPSQLIQDAQRRGIVVQPVDVMLSDCASTLEEHADRRLQPAVRLGLDRVGGLGGAAAQRIIEARIQQPFSDAGDLARRSALNARELGALAAADALLTLVGHRREARWAAAVNDGKADLLQHAPIHEQLPLLPEASEGQAIVADYASLGLSLRRHPLALLRPRLRAMRLSSAAELQTFPDGRMARTTGIVTVRQRPGTAKGTIFVTIEDETGNTNVIVWNDVGRRQRRELLGATLLTVYGVWQRQGRVTHLIAKRLVDDSHLLGALMVESRDFY